MATFPMIDQHHMTRNYNPKFGSEDLQLFNRYNDRLLDQLQKNEKYSDLKYQQAIVIKKEKGIPMVMVSTSDHKGVSLVLAWGLQSLDDFGPQAGMFGAKYWLCVQNLLFGNKPKQGEIRTSYALNDFPDESYVLFTNLHSACQYWESCLADQPWTPTNTDTPTDTDQSSGYIRRGIESILIKVDESEETKEVEINWSDPMGQGYPKKDLVQSEYIYNFQIGKPVKGPYKSPDYSDFCINEPLKFSV